MVAGLCLARAALTVAVGTSQFTLAWTHSIEKTAFVLAASEFTPTTNCASSSNAAPWAVGSQNAALYA